MRPVATTEWPAPSAALAMSTPMPRPAPVMNHTFLSVMPRPCLVGRRGTRSSGSQRGLRGVVDTGTARTPQGVRSGPTLLAMDNKDDVREFLATRRAKITPQDAGL